MFLLSKNIFSQTFIPITVTGHTRDVIAEASSAVTTTNIGMDLQNHVLYTQAFAASQSIAGGLPNSGTIVNGLRTYQLASFTSNNAFYLQPSTTQTITFTTPAKYSKLSMCGFSTQGSSVIKAVVHFTDGTTFTPPNFNIADWFFGTGNVSCCYGRVVRNPPPYTPNGLPSNPQFDRYEITLSCANQKKLVQKIVVQYISGNSSSTRMFVMAVSGVPYNFSSVDFPGHIVCTGPGTGTDTIIVSGNSGPYQYSWNTVPVQTGNIATGLSAGNYICTITDINNCVNKDTITILEDSVAIASIATSEDSICIGDSVQLSVTGLLSYTWQPNGLQDSSTYVLPIATTNYVVSGTNNSGCSGADTITIYIKPNPTLTITPGISTICFGDSIALQASGAVSYSWLPSNTLNNLNTASVIANPSFATTYTLSGTNAFGCTSQTNATVNVSQLPNINVNNATICLGNSAIITAQGAGNYVWSPSTSLSNSSGVVVSATPTATSTYTVIGNIQGCYDTATAVVTVNPLPATPVITALLPTAFCIGDSTILSTTTYSSYLWSTSQTQNTISAYFSGNYTVSGIDSNGCVSLPSAPINVMAYTLPLPPTLIANSSTTICMNDSLLLSLQTNVFNPIFSWNPTAINVNNDSVYVHLSNTYNAIVTDTNGCVSVQSNSIVVNATPLPAAPSIIPIGSTSFCDGDSVILSMTMAGNYLWNTNETTSNIIVKTTGNYFVNVVDTCGITHTPNITVNVFPNPVAMFSVADSSGCAPFDFKPTNLSSGAVTYNWDIGNNTFLPGFEPGHQFNIPGIYTIKLIAFSSQGCINELTKNDVISVGGPPILGFTFTPDSVLINETTKFIRFYSTTQNADSIYWLSKEYEVSGTGNEFQVTMPDTGLHRVTLYAYTNLGCSDSLIKEIYVAGGFSFYMPNAFSPTNNDLLNASFKPSFIHIDKQAFELEIFDRWGIKVTTIKNPDVGWDGKINGEYKTGIYNWIVNCLDDRGVKHQFSGSVSLL